MDNTKPTDESIVAALDAEYQEAVKNNHVAAMDRILADDFVLVTGNGTCVLQGRPAKGGG